MFNIFCDFIVLMKLRPLLQKNTQSAPWSPILVQSMLMDGIRQLKNSWKVRIIVSQHISCLQAVLGKPVQRLAKVDQTLLESLLRCSEPDDDFKTVKGTTFCSDDFYEGSSCVYIWALTCMLKKNACIISCLYFLVGKWQINWLIAAM